jgi:hypothetical protein
MFRSRVYCRIQTPRLKAANSIQNGGLPGRKKTTALVFHAAMSQKWCQRSNSGKASTANTASTTPNVVTLSGSASMYPRKIASGRHTPYATSDRRSVVALDMH